METKTFKKGTARLALLAIQQAIPNLKNPLIKLFFFNENPNKYW
jgi:hypothetical protein